MFEAVLFDWDGTLADTRHAVILSFRKALKKVNVEVPDELVERQLELVLTKHSGKSSRSRVDFLTII